MLSWSQREFCFHCQGIKQICFVRWGRSLTWRIHRYQDCYHYAESVGRCSSEIASYWRASQRLYRICTGINGTTKSDNDEFPKICYDVDESTDDEREAVDSHTLCDTFLIFC